MLIKAAINGGRTRAEHPAVPITLAEQAKDAAQVIAAGAGAIHVHPRNAEGLESLDPDDIAGALEAIRVACPKTLVGVSTGAWITRDTTRRISLIREWYVQPDFASVNIHEEGAFEVIRLLLRRGIGVEAGVWNAAAANQLLKSGLAPDCLRVLIEPAEAGGDAMANFNQIDAALAQISLSRLLHGAGASAWQFVALAAKRGYDTRAGLEDTLALPDGAVADNNAALVLAARRVAEQSVQPDREPPLKK